MEDGEGLESSDVMNLNETLIISSATGRKSAAKNNANMVIKFYDKKMPNISESTEEGIVYHKKTYTFIQRAGDKTSIIDRPLRESDKRAYPKQWRLYVEGRDQSAGTPITAMMSKGLLATHQYHILNVNGIKTVEQLAEASFGTLDNLGPDGAQMQRLAKGLLAELAPKAKADAVDDLKAELEELKKAVGLKVEAKKEVSSKPKRKAAAPKKKVVTLEEEGFSLPEMDEQIENIELPQL